MKPSENLTILEGDVLERLLEIAPATVQTVVTSPPYWGLRDYGVKGQLGLEATPQEYVDAIVRVFRALRPCLKPDATVWLNLGDSYAGSGKGAGDVKTRNRGNEASRGARVGSRHGEPGHTSGVTPPPGLKRKDLVGIPWRVALALQADGWYLRSDIIWHKKNCMPESVGRRNGKWTHRNGRPTRAHEYMFLLSPGPDYYYDSEAVAEPCIWDVDGTGTQSRKARAAQGLKSHPSGQRAGIRPGVLKDARKMKGKHGSTLSGGEHGRHALGDEVPDKDRREAKQRGHSRRHDGFNDRWDAMNRLEQCTGMRNKRDVWTVAPAQFADAHFATFPPELIEPCILAGSRKGDVVLDPFLGSGTTAMVSLWHGRKALGIELSPKYVRMAKRRCKLSNLDRQRDQYEEAKLEPLPLFEFTVGGKN